MSKGNKKEVKTYLRKKNKMKVIQEEPEEIAKEKTPPLDANPKIVIIESAEISQKQVREAKGKGKRLMFQEMEKQASEPKRPRTRSELKNMVEKTQEASPKPPKVYETQQEVSPPTYSVQERELPHEKDLVKLRELKRLFKQARIEVVTVRQQNRYLSESLVEHLQICAPTMQSVRKMLRRSKPLHKQVLNLYKQNLSLKEHRRDLQEENKTLTKESEMVKSKLSKRNLKLLAKAASASK
jgi:hypothetical protein